MLCSARAERFHARGHLLAAEEAARERARRVVLFLHLQVLREVRHAHLQGHPVPLHSLQRAARVPDQQVRLGGLRLTASHGCIRLRVEDAKFIAENCMQGTAVRIYSSNEPDAELRALLYESSYSNENGLSYDDYLGIPDDPRARPAVQHRPGGRGLAVPPARARVLFRRDQRHLPHSTITPSAGAEGARSGADRLHHAGAQGDSYSSEAPTAMNIELSEGMSGPVVLNCRRTSRRFRCTRRSRQRLRRRGRRSGEPLPADLRLSRFQRRFPPRRSRRSTMKPARSRRVPSAASTSARARRRASRWRSSIPASACASASARSTNSEALDKVTDGEQLLLLEKGDEWSKVQYGSTVGYMKNVFLQFTTWDTVTLTFSEVGGDQVYTIGNTLAEYQAGAPSRRRRSPRIWPRRLPRGLRGHLAVRDGEHRLGRHAAQPAQHALHVGRRRPQRSPTAASSRVLSRAPTGRWSNPIPAAAT